MIDVETKHEGAPIFIAGRLACGPSNPKPMALKDA